MYNGYTMRISVDLFQEDLDKIRKIREEHHVDDLEIFSQLEIGFEGTEDDHPVVIKILHIYGENDADIILDSRDEYDTEVMRIAKKQGIK